ncbi:hypothetical protein [Marinobacterium lutimaris]|nr:hypothetical protein [Marinobacterium lutimaris]
MQREIHPYLKYSRTGFTYRGSVAFGEFTRKSAATNGDILKDAGLVK